MTKDKDTYAIIGSDGSLEVYSDPYANISEETVLDSIKVEDAIVNEKMQVARSFIKMAYLLDDFEARKLYLARGYPSFRTWVSSPEVDLSPRVANDLLRIRREVVPILTEQLGGDEVQAILMLSLVGVAKARVVLPLLNLDKTAELTEILSEASEQTYRDVIARVKEVTTGKPEDITERSPAVFKGTVHKGETNTRIRISVMDGVSTESCGTLYMRNEHVSRFITRFGDFIEFADSNKE